VDWNVFGYGEAKARENMKMEFGSRAGLDHFHLFFAWLFWLNPTFHFFQFFLISIYSFFNTYKIDKNICIKILI